MPYLSAIWKGILYKYIEWVPHHWSVPFNINKTHFACCSGELWTNVHFMILKCIYKYFILSFHTVSVCESRPAMDWRPVWPVCMPFAHSMPGSLHPPWPLNMNKWILKQLYAVFSKKKKKFLKVADIAGVYPMWRSTDSKRAQLPHKPLTLTLTLTLTLREKVEKSSTFRVSTICPKCLKTCFHFVTMTFFLPIWNLIRNTKSAKG